MTGDEVRINPPGLTADEVVDILREGIRGTRVPRSLGGTGVDLPPPDELPQGVYLYRKVDTPSDESDESDDDLLVLWSGTVAGRVETHGAWSRWIPDDPPVLRDGDQLEFRWVSITDTPDPESGLTVEWTSSGVTFHTTTTQEDPCQDS